ncbi:MAG TPA: metallopeptidase family protein [Candidatus Baltobacteraceae bacterium]|jgi:predicted Zn-dependent protease with MMP-like domain
MKPLSTTEFEQVVDEALDSLPRRFADLVHNVAISVEEEPTEEDLALDDGHGGDHDDDVDEDGEPYELLGIYRGVALTDRAYGEPPMLPDEIAVFRGPINRFARSRREAVDEIRETVIHELGHYFGLDEHELP